LRGKFERKVLDKWVVTLIDLRQDLPTVLRKTFQNGFSFTIKAFELDAGGTRSSIV